jgi:hypothetical protein
MSTVLAALVPVFLLIALGAVITWVKLLGREGWAGVERLTYHVLIPAFMIVTLAKADLAATMVAEAAAVFVGAVLAMGALTALVWRTIGRGVDGPAYTSLFQGACRWNSFAAIAIAGSLYGLTGATVAAIAVIAMVPLLNILCVAVLVRHAQGRPMSAAGFARTLIANPFIWSALVGLGFNVGGAPLPGVVMTTLDMLARATLAISLVMVGGGLDLRTVGKIDKPVALAVALKLVAMPALMLAGCFVLGLGGAVRASIVLCGAVPTASASYLLAKQMGGDADLMARIVTIQTLLAMATMPAWLLALA